jgi:hypothetical protein
LEAALSDGPRICEEQIPAREDQHSISSIIRTSVCPTSLFTGVDTGGHGILNSTAGQIVNTIGTSRQMQLALKLRF